MAESSLDPRQVLAQRLRALRESHWPQMKVTQPELARVLDGQRHLSVPLISSWESQGKPKIPPIPRLEAYATFFATSRSVEGATPRLLGPDELTETEKRARDELRTELLQLRKDALRATGGREDHQIADALATGLWRFGDGQPIVIVCAQLPADKLERMPYADPADPDYVQLYSYADLDALFELHGHVRAANPTSLVNWRAAHQLAPDDYTAHLISLGGVDWNVATESVLDRLQLPVRQVADWDSPEGPYFEIAGGDRAVRHYPRLERSGNRQLLREDVALFARATNPYNRLRTVTICNGMYGSGSYGAVRALTDERFRDRNGEYVQTHFSGSQVFCILTRVTVLNGVPVTPDWSVDDNRLFEWAA